MSGIRGVGSSPSQGINPRSEIEPVKPGSQAQPEAITGQEALEGPEGLKEAGELSEAQAQQKADELAREKKSMQQNATERMGEEAMKAQVKQTQTNEEFDASQSGKVDADKTHGPGDRSYIHYREKDPQAVPQLKKDGSYQRWNVADKRWE